MNPVATKGCKPRQVMITLLHIFALKVVRQKKLRMMVFIVLMQNCKKSKNVRKLIFSGRGIFAKTRKLKLQQIKKKFIYFANQTKYHIYVVNSVEILL